MLCVWINVDASADYNPPPFEPVASFFGISHKNYYYFIIIIFISLLGIWHEHKRGAHKGLHEFHYSSNYVLLVNVYALGGDSYKKYMPADASVIDNNNFKKDVKSFANEKINNAKRIKMNINSYVSTLAGISCDEICSNIGSNIIIYTNTHSTTNTHL